MSIIILATISATQENK
ncbi:hypothetical protein POY05_13240 [Escherichia coli]